MTSPRHGEIQTNRRTAIRRNGSSRPRSALKTFSSPAASAVLSLILAPLSTLVSPAAAAAAAGSARTPGAFTFSLEFDFLLAVAVALAAGFASSAVLRRRSARRDRKVASAAPSRRTSEPDSRIGGALELGPSASAPTGMFPGRWLERADRPGLERWLTDSAEEAVAAHEAALGPPNAASNLPPSAATLEAAEKAALAAFERTLRTGEIFALMDGGRSFEPAEKRVLTIHLQALTPQPRLGPPPAPTLRLRPSAAALTAALGAFLGHLLGGAVFAWLGRTVLTGATIGAVLGAAAAVQATVRLSRNEGARKVALAAVGGIALLDSLIQIARGALPPAFAAGGGGSLLKRAAFYAGAILTLTIIKADKTFDRAALRRGVRVAVEASLTAAISLSALLTFKLEETRDRGEGDENAHPIEAAASLVKRLLARPGAEEDALLAELARELSLAGFDMTPASPPHEPARLIWENSLMDLYEPFGLIKIGQPVLVESEPLIRDGRIVRKGQVVRESGAPRLKAGVSRRGF